MTNSLDYRDFLSRFYHVKRAGGQQVFYDCVSGDWNLFISHIHASLMQKFNISYKDAQKLLEGHFFTPIVQKQIYAPNKPPVVQINYHNYPNLWTAPVFESYAADAKPFVDHLNDVLGDHTRVDYLLDVLAWRLQNPDKPKPHRAFYFYHKQGGCGKSLFAKTLRRVLGENSVKTLNTTNNLSSMNVAEAWLCSWLIIEEATIGKGAKDYDKIKSFTGGDTTDSEAKHEGIKRRESPAMLIMMSNRPPAMIEEFDRRFLVSEWALDSYIDKQEYFDRYIQWLESGGYGAIHQYLADRRVPNVIPEPPMTPEKEAAMGLSINAEVLAVKDLIDDAKDAWFFSEKAFEDVWEAHGISTNRRRHVLIDAGLEPLSARTLIGKNRYRLYKRAEAYIERTSYGNIGCFNGAQKPLKDVAKISKHYLSENL